MSFSSLAFFGRKEFELAVPTGHLDLATIEGSQVAPILTEFNVGKTLCVFNCNRRRVPKRCM
jgi:hypothetical protein